MSKLDDILGKPNAKAVISDNNVVSVNFNTPKQKQQFKDLMLELIGEDEFEDTDLGGGRFSVDNQIRGKNKLRAELRQKVEEL